MALPKDVRLKGHRTFNYIYKNSKRYYGKHIDLRVAKSKPEILLSHKFKSTVDNFKIAITVSKKISKKSVVRNKIRRKLHQNFLDNFKPGNNHVPYWVIVNLKAGNSMHCEKELLDEFQKLISKSGVFK